MRATPGERGLRTVLVSGAGSGFGAECVRAFAARGDRVIAAVRDSARHACIGGPSIDVRALDVTDAGSIESCVASVIADHGQIDVLVNSAGIHLLGAMEDMDEADFRLVFVSRERRESLWLIAQRGGRRWRGCRRVGSRAAACCVVMCCRGR